MNRFDPSGIREQGGGKFTTGIYWVHCPRGVGGDSSGVWDEEFLEWIGSLVVLGNPHRVGNIVGDPKSTTLNSLAKGSK